MKDLKIFEAINHVRKKSPHVFALLDLAKIKINDKIPTACIYFDSTSKKFIIEISKYFYENLDALNLAAILEHEILHLLFDHLFDDTLKDKKTANIAQDAIINDLIDIFKNDKCDKILENRVKLSKINASFSVNYNTSREVYDYLKKNPEKIPELSNIDDHGPWEKNTESMSEVDRASIMDVLKSTIKANESKMQGLGSKDLEMIIKNALKPTYNFRALFENVIKKSLKSDCKRTWKKANRRLSGQAKGIKKAIKPKVLLLVDTSGSMVNDSILNKIRYQIEYLSRFYDFEVCYGDTKLLGHEKIEKNKKIDFIFKGGGGTDLNFYKDLLKLNTYDLIIFDTDGFIAPIKDIDKIPKIFCIYDNGIEVPNYKNIFIK